MLTLEENFFDLSANHLSTCYSGYSNFFHYKRHICSTCKSLKLRRNIKKEVKNTQMHSQNMVGQITGASLKF